MRHPRYGGALLGVVAVALFVNYLGIYVMGALLFPGLYLVTILEEKELSERFGDPYRKYQRQVPRFIPKWRVNADEPQNQA
jgi:protein-S-isoprenylcysteine O-methyltransferase Ste14